MQWRRMKHTEKHRKAKFDRYIHVELLQALGQLECIHCRACVEQCHVTRSIPLQLQADCHRVRQQLLCDGSKLGVQRGADKH